MLDFKRYWEETIGDPLTEPSGTSTYYFKTDKNGEVLRQIQLFENGRKLKYDQVLIQDELGAIGS